MRVPGPPCGDSPARQALSTACATPAPWGAQARRPFALSQLLARRTRAAATSLSPGSLGFKGPLYGEVCTRTLSAEVVDLAWGVASVRAPQGILTKLDQTCKTEIPLKYCSYIFSWTVSLSGHSGLCACLAPQPRAVEQLPLMIGVCPPFCGHISLHRLFLEKIFFCAHTFVTRVKIKHRGHWFPRKSESTSLWV